MAPRGYFQGEKLPKPRKFRGISDVRKASQLVTLHSACGRNHSHGDDDKGDDGDEDYADACGWAGIGSMVTKMLLAGDLCMLHVRVDVMCLCMWMYRLAVGQQGNLGLVLYAVYPPETYREV